MRSNEALRSASETGAIDGDGGPAGEANGKLNHFAPVRRVFDSEKARINTRRSRRRAVARCSR